MTIYHTPRSPHYITVGQFVFYPSLMFAKCTHNGAPVYFHEKKDGSWNIESWGCPSQWMMDELIAWFNDWVAGKVHTNNYKDVKELLVQ